MENKSENKKNEEKITAKSLTLFAEKPALFIMKKKKEAKNKSNLERYHRKKAEKLRLLESEKVGVQIV